MATYSKVALSGATTGVPIAVAQTASTGTTIRYWYIFNNI